MRIGTGIWGAGALLGVGVSLYLLIAGLGPLYLNTMSLVLFSLTSLVWIREARQEILTKRRVQFTERDLCERLMVIDYENTARRVCRCGRHKLK